MPLRLSLNVFLANLCDVRAVIADFSLQYSFNLTTSIGSIMIGIEVSQLGSMYYICGY